MNVLTSGPLNPDSPSVQTHLRILQDIIGRLAGNSASCKTWCVSITSALAVVAASQANHPRILSVAALPTLLFCLLDAYYLGLERRFRECYNTFVKKLHNGTASADDVFLLEAKLTFPGFFKELGPAILSFSIWPFYAGLGVALWFLKARLWGRM
jgi:hypothetical protein